MADINNITIIGRLTAKPTLKYLQNGMQVAEFTIANNYYNSSKNANEVNYFECVAYGKTAEAIDKYTDKGSLIAINGALRQERWQDKDTNQTRSRVRIIVSTIQLLGSKGNKGEANNGFSDNEEPPF